MDTYSENTVFSSIDTYGRYAYKNQPAVGAWNLAKLAGSLLPLFCEDEDAAAEMAMKEIANYWAVYNERWLEGMRAKLGFITEEAEDARLIEELLGLISANGLDYTHTLRSITLEGQGFSSLLEIKEFADWQNKRQARLMRQPHSADYVMSIMRKNNPAVIPRNYRVEEALAAAEHGDFTVMDCLLSALKAPYEDSKIYSQPPEPSAKKYKTFCGT